MRNFKRCRCKIVKIVMRRIEARSWGVDVLDLPVIVLGRLIFWVALVLSGLIDFSNTALACIIVVGISLASKLCLSFDLSARANGY